MSASSLLAADSLWELFSRAVSLRDYNTRVVLAGTTMLGVSGGLVGTFLILRKRALAADVVGGLDLLDISGLSSRSSQERVLRGDPRIPNR